MNLTQWLLTCGFVSWISYNIGRMTTIAIANRVVRNHQKDGMARIEELAAKIDSCRTIRDEHDRIRFENQTRANAN